MAVSLPDKLYFRIGEVSEITGVKPYVLRYWETEFPSVKPEKTRSNQRRYRKSDIETILLIKNLLYDQRFTIEGARERLKTMKRQRPDDSDKGGKESLQHGGGMVPVHDAVDALERLKEGLVRLKGSL